MNIARPSAYSSSRRSRTRGRALLVGFVGMITRSIPPRLCRSSRPQAQSRRDTKSPLELRFRDGELPLVSARGRRGACGACVLDLPALRERAVVDSSGLVRPLSLSGFCCGPRYAAIWRPRAVAISRRLAALATTCHGVAVGGAGSPSLQRPPTYALTIPIGGLTGDRVPPPARPRPNGQTAGRRIA